MRWRRPISRTRLARLSAFVAQQDLDIILCAGFMPAFADLTRERCLLFMALLQPSAYRAAPARVSARASERHPVGLGVGACRTSARCSAAPGAVVRSMLPTGIRERPTDENAANLRRDPHRAWRHVAAAQAAAGGDQGCSRCCAIAGSRSNSISTATGLRFFESYLDELNGDVAELDLQDRVVAMASPTMHHIARDNDVVLSASVDESLPQTLAETDAHGPCRRRVA